MAADDNERLPPPPPAVTMWCPRCGRDDFHTPTNATSGPTHQQPNSYRECHGTPVPLVHDPNRGELVIAEESPALALIRIAVDDAVRVARSTAYVPHRWPNTYATDFLFTCPDVVPEPVRRQLGRIQNRIVAMSAIDRWTEHAHVSRPALIALLADAFLAMQGIPLDVADRERELYFALQARREEDLSEP